MTEIVPEFSRIYRLDQIPSSGMQAVLRASEAECAALAERFGLHALYRLEAHVRLKAMSGGKLFRLDGHVQAELAQVCVVSLEPVPATVDEDFTLTYTTEVEEEVPGAEIDLYMDEADPPDIIENGMIDAGEAVAEHLALALDPFPRRPDAVFTEVDDAPDEPKKANPFEILRKLQKNAP